MQSTADQVLRKAMSFATRGQVAEAAELYRSVLAKFPSNKRARDGLAALSAATGPSDDEVQMLVALYRQGRLGELIARAAPLAETHPASVFLHNIAGAAYAGMGRLAEAIDSYDRATQLKPDFADAYSNRGVALQQLHRLSEALDSHDMAIRLKPDYTEAHSNRGNVLQALQRRADAVASYGKAIQLSPDYAEAYSNRAMLLKELNRPGEALGDCDKAIALKPDFADAHSNRGVVLRALGRLAEAVDSYDEAIRLRPDYAEAHSNRAVALRELGRLIEAVDSYDAAIRLRPDYADAFYNRGNALQDLKRLDEAANSYAMAVRFEPDQVEALNQLAYQNARMCRWDDKACAVDPAILGIETAAVTPFAMLLLEDNAERHLQRAKAFSSSRYPHVDAGPARRNSPGSRLRIGYFSADFHDHATMYLMAKLFDTHDKARFEIHIFSYGPDRQDGMRRRLIGAADRFHDVRDLSDQAVAELAREQAIDIAVDLKGHTQHSRSGIFAHRAAPIQINYLGYPGSMGADFIDYMIVDKVIVPEDQQRHYSEKLIYLPGSYQVNDDSRAIADAVPSREALGLPEQGFVFCSFNNNYKITPAEFDIWMRLLSRVDGSVLWLLKDNVWAEANLREEARARGVDPARLVFAERALLADHLARHRCADLFLDSFTVNAHTTASDALWASLPIVTRLGQSFAARVAGSLLHAIGMPELVTETSEAYEQLALELATNPDKLAAIKATLAHRRTTTALFDSAQFTRHIEQGYELAHDRYRRSLRPDHIEVPAIRDQAAAA